MNISNSLYPSLFLLLALPLHASSSEEILGLVEVPKLFGETHPDGGQETKNRQPIELFSEPKPSAKVKIQVKTSDEMVAREYGYEEKGAVVFARSGSWFCVRSKKGSGWLAPLDTGKFHSYEALIKSGMSYLTASWSKRLYSSPNLSAAFKTPAIAGEEAGSYEPWQLPVAGVEILGSRQVNGRLWFEVQLIFQRCEPDGEKKGEKGWVQAFDEKGQPTLWFHSRGC